jgi:hypothetical protein
VLRPHAQAHLSWQYSPADFEVCPGRLIHCFRGGVLRSYVISMVAATVSLTFTLTSIYVQSNFIIDVRNLFQQLPPTPLPALHYLLRLVHGKSIIVDVVVALVP